MAHQELAAEIMAMRVAADEAEERRVERKMVRLCWDADNNTVGVWDVGALHRVSRDAYMGKMNGLFDAGWSIERELKVKHQEELHHDMAAGTTVRYDGRGELIEKTKMKAQFEEETLLVLVRKAPRNED